MKSFKTIATSLSLLLVTFAGSRCSTNEDEFFSIEVQSPKAYIIPAKTYSCKSIATIVETPDLDGPYFTVTRPKINWKHPYNHLWVIAINVTFDHPSLGGNYRCTIADEELRSTVTIGTTMTSNINLSATQSFSNTNSATLECGLVCSGVNAEEKNFTARGKIEVIAVMETPQGEQIPVRTSTPFAIENLVR